MHVSQNDSVPQEEGSSSCIKEIPSSAGSGTTGKVTGHVASNSVFKNPQVMEVPSTAVATTREHCRTLRPGLPQLEIDASSVDPMQQLEQQLDSMQGQELLPGTRILPGLSNRCRGGTRRLLLFASRLCFRH